MRKDNGPQRNADGKITKAAQYQSRDVPQARVEPNRKWFTNTRVISQDNLTAFREAMAEKASDPYQVLLKSNKLPMSLLREENNVNGLKQHAAKMTVESAPFSDVFGPKAQRKRVKIGAGSLAEVLKEPELAALPAVRNGRAYAIWNYLGGTVLNVAALQAMAGWLYPDLAATLDAGATLAEINGRFAAVPWEGTFWIGL